eukprot:maker-scaffold740_size104176-snap-gene-0.26 protein:Tk09504 transcript:maker-scaffold740_size104176-snap-gene-0.26-mRNA-1 annotation:"hypothetical protein CAEBREN_06668"
MSHVGHMMFHLGNTHAFHGTSRDVGNARRRRISVGREFMEPPTGPLHRSMRPAPRPSPLCLFVLVALVGLLSATSSLASEQASASANEPEDEHAAQARFSRSSPLRWGKRGSEILRWGKREPLRWGKRSTDELTGQRTVREAPLRWGKRSSPMDLLLVEENEPQYARFQREASPLRWGKRLFVDSEDKRAPLRWGKRAPSRFGKRAPNRFGKRESLEEYLDEMEADFE